ncbi:MAG: hypothetical protein M3367_00415 [Acidobacteriota bacterium]|nr:hypothetical protein [Acidobacteriota bacterium]
MIYNILKIFARIFAFFLRRQGLFLIEFSKFVSFKKNLVGDKFFLAADELSEFGNKREREKIVFLTKLKSFFEGIRLLCKITSHYFEAFYISLLIKLLQITRVTGLLSLYVLKMFLDLLSLFKVQKAPGSKLIAVADFLFKKQIVKGVFEQIVCDWRNDYFEALSEKRLMKARWISIRGHWEFYCAAFKQSPIGDLIEEIRKFVK